MGRGCLRRGRSRRSRRGLEGATAASRLKLRCEGVDHSGPRSFAIVGERSVEQVLLQRSPRKERSERLDEAERRKQDKIRICRGEG
jgi:hypothetical protein